MNRVELVGRLTRDPDIRYTANQMCIATFYLAIDRPQKEGQEKKADFPCVKVFGRPAEAIETYCKKGKMVAVTGSLQTGSYEGKNGKVYTTDVVADKVDFLRDEKPAVKPEEKPEEKPVPEERQMGFASLDEDVPF